MRNHQQLEDFFGIGDGGASPHESIRESITRRIPFRMRMRLLPKVLSKRERYAMVILVLVAALSLVAIPIGTFYHFTESVPADGGKLVEGIVGEPRLVNPLLAQTSDADRDLVALVFSGLYRYNGDGRLVPDLAKSLPEITSDGLTYSVTLRDDALWHDNLPVTADDVIFTVEVAQNQDYGAPTNVRALWGGVTVERVSDRVVAFRLKTKYAQFPNNLTLGLLPKHLWEDVRPINFAYAELNIKPIGSGPYRFKSLTKNDLGRIHAYRLEAFDQFYGGRPRIDEFEFRFFGTEDELIDAFNKNEIDNVSFISGSNAARLKFRGRIDLEQLKMPRYFALFFNQNQSRALADKNVRLALNQATDRIGIINSVLDGNGFLINSPLMGGILDINANVKSYDYNPDQAASVLDAGGWKEAEDGIRQKSAENRLQLRITTSTWSELIDVAQKVKEQWEELGAEVTVEALPVSQLQEVIRQRSYQILLFGQILTPDPDPFSAWHSSQREGLGINLALYNNKTADKLLEEARQTLNPLERAQKYDEFQKILIEDIPAVFLYSSHYLYGLDDNVDGFDTTLIAVPEERFSNVANWYLKTKRVFK
ncbi:MAG TPA: ABC transporter substrate-binding protein [Candidatus Paceibacterota bacterium]|nr:ABC transporter substrate-binding protein [Candidatus Paceibacterota bacterium]